VLRHLRFVFVLLPIAAIAQAPGPLQPLPPPPVPAGNPITLAKANLGKLLFWDEQLSSSRAVACGTCHRPSVGGADPRSIASMVAAANPGPDGLPGNDDDVVGSPGVVRADAGGAYVGEPAFGVTPQVTPRHTPSQMNTAYAPSLFWDGRAGEVFLDPVTSDTVLATGGALESQAVAPPLSTVEMGHLGRDWPAVLARLQAVRPLALAAWIPPALNAWIADRDYPELFEEAFGTPEITPARIGLAIATYERTLISNDAKIDSVIAGQVTLTPQEQQGQNLFIAMQCNTCHVGSLFSDNQFHFIGVRPASEDVGRFAVTGDPAHMGAFKTPSLRNVGLRSSFFHNGRFGTLEEVVEFYNRGGDFTAPNKPFSIHALGLNTNQKAALVAYMRGPLTDHRVRDALPPFDRPSLYSEETMVPIVTGTGVAGSGGHEPIPVAVEPPLSGNPEFTIGVYRGLGGAAARLVIDFLEPAADGTPGPAPPFAEIQVTLQGSGDGNGFGSATLAIPTDPALIGQTLYARWFVDDPAAPGSLAASAVVRFRVFGNHAEGVLAVEPRAASLPRALRLAPGRPTPFAASTAIAYELYTASRVRLTVFDAQGRAVRRLVEGALQAPGPYTVTWDGRDDGGRVLAAGVYFYRLEGGGDARSMRAVKID
jgi:cytochrome c peroxidase